LLEKEKYFIRRKKMKASKILILFSIICFFAVLHAYPIDSNEQELVKLIIILKKS